MLVEDHMVYWTINVLKYSGNLKNFIWHAILKNIDWAGSNPKSYKGCLRYFYTQKDDKTVDWTQDQLNIYIPDSLPLNYKV